MSQHSVIVGDLVVVRDGTWKEAKTAFIQYRKQSKAGCGRVSGESVTWLRDGEPYIEYIGALNKPKAEPKVEVVVNWRRRRR